MDGKHVCFAAHGHDTGQHRRLVRLECDVDFPLVDIHWLRRDNDAMSIQWESVDGHWGWPVTAPREALWARQRGAMAPVRLYACLCSSIGRESRAGKLTHDKRQRKNSAIVGQLDLL
jgi:hypothetical protein